MPRRSKSQSKRSNTLAASGKGSASEQAAVAQTADASSSKPKVGQVAVVDAPWTAIQRLLSILIFGHFAALILAISSNLYQSVLQQQAISLMGAYLVTTSQVYGAMPLEWTHAEPYDFPLELEVQMEDENRWERILPGEQANGIAAKGRWLNLQRILRLVLDDEPESEIVAEIALTAIRRTMNQEPMDLADKRLKAIRFVQPYVPSYADAELIMEGMQDEVDTAPRVIYEAAVVYEATQPVGLLPKLESYRNAKAIAARPSDASGQSANAALEQSEPTGESVP